MDKYNFASFVAKINTQIKPSIKDSHHLQKRKKNRSHCFRMGFEKVAWKDGKIPANWMNSHMPLKLRNGLLGCTERSQRILHVKAINVVSWCAGEAAQEKKKKEDPKAPGYWQLLCVCVSQTDRNDKPSHSRRAEQPESPHRMALRGAQQCMTSTGCKRSSPAVLLAAGEGLPLDQEVTFSGRLLWYGKWVWSIKDKRWRNIHPFQLLPSRILAGFRRFTF